MRKYSGIPELLEQFMREQGADKRWVTVKELRDRFGLTRYQCNTVSGFLRRLEFGTFGRYPFTVLRIERVDGEGPAAPPKCRYFITRKDLPAKGTLDMRDHARVLLQRSIYSE
ncbi:hypothetical protein [Methanoregula sp.]|uniref:hypothetical protein n=1 Tax=Methanoregula sp. TaxID=2052170 RepID=UPI003BAF3565